MTNKVLTANLETYQALKARQADELNKFEGIFFAFSNEQFEEGMVGLGLTKADTSKIVSIGAGGFILKERVGEFAEMFKRHAKEKKQRKQDEKFLLEMLVYELRNHEYCITYDTTDALNALGLKKEDIDTKLMKQAVALAV